VDERSRNCPNCGTELNTGQFEEFAGPDSPRFHALTEVKSRLGRKAQVGGGIALFIGVLLRVAGGPASGSKDVIHKMPIAFIVIGIFGILVGTFGRWYYLD
jgi:hypothetical protein